MDITVYLPDALGQWAKNAGLNLSQTLRAEVEREQRRRTASREAVAGDVEVFMLPVEEAGRAYVVRFHGVPLHDKRNEVQAFIGENDEIYAYDERDGRFGQFTSDGAVSRAEWLRGWLDDDEDYIDAMTTLGEQAVIDVGAVVKEGLR